MIIKLVSIVFLLLSASIIASPVIAETVRVPIKLDYPVLRQLMQRQLFNTPGNKVEVLNDATGCSTIFLSDPRLRENQQKLEITAHVKAAISASVFGDCTPLFNWEGDAQFLTEPVIQPGARSVRLKILSVQLYNPQGELITGQVWDLASGQLLSLMSRYEVDLSPTIDQLKKLLPDILDRRSAVQISKISDSLRLSEISVAADGIDVAINLQIDRLPATQEPAALLLSAEEIQQLEANWQMMDAMVTFAVKRYARATSQQDLRDALVEILLDARYRLRDALAKPVTRANDPVRHWFIDSWKRLGPVLRQISLENAGQEPMLLVSLLAATDALEILDRLGPSIGLDISANGLRRLGRMLIDQPGINPLQYDEAVDPELRQFFQLPATPESRQSSGFRFDFSPIRSAWAKSSNERLELWVPKKSELPEYLPIIRKLLADSASTAETNQLDASVKKIFQNLVLATAWQESCWRQYVVKNKKIVTLRSSSGDTGLMQINERVWRGLYNTQKLRWDTAYNARAGVEVLHRYLVKYSLKRGEQKHKGGLDNLARSAYSAYNAGPDQTSRYRNPKAPAAHQKIDAAFWEKYQAVKQGKELQVAECLGGDLSDIVKK